MWIFLVCVQFPVAFFCYDFEIRSEAIDKYFECVRLDGKDITLDSMYIDGSE